MMLSSLPLAGAYPKLTSFFSLIYLAFFLPACVLIYALCPQKLRKYWLLLASWGFFWLISGELIVFLLLSTLSVYGFGLWLGALSQKRDALVKAAERPQRKAIKKKYQGYSRMVLGIAALVHIGSLLVVKYTGFFLTNVNSLLRTAISIPRFVMPIGISFFSLQAFGYLFDVYRGTVQPDRNPGRVALFMAFFPQIVEGPICRYDQTAQQLWAGAPITYDNLTMGLQRIGYGMLKKVVIADRLNPFVEGIFSDFQSYDGGILALAAVAYTIQLYMDFSGAMDAVTGTAQIFGIAMPENFRRPFFSRTVSEFWTRWHISLGGWFRDVIYYPVTMSSPMKKLVGKARKKLGNYFGPLTAGAVALFCVWFCNGLWHGAAWSYLFFGMYHFVIILTGSLIAPGVRTLQGKFRINPEHWGYRLMQTLRTCILVVIGELFFRANGLRAGMGMFRKIVTDFRFTGLNSGLLKALHMDGADFVIVGITLVIVLTVSLLQERGIEIRKTLASKPLALRWAVYLGLILYILVFGAYGQGYIPVNPMYANF